MHVTPEQVQAMIEEGFSARRVAVRLGCSERHVRRLAAGRSLRFWENDLIGTPEERTVLWAGYLEAGASARRVAFRFGVSHQTVLDFWHTHNNAHERAAEAAR